MNNETEFDIKELIGMALLHWKRVIIIGLALMVLLGVFKYFKPDALEEAETEEVVEDTTQAAEIVIAELIEDETTPEEKEALKTKKINRITELYESYNKISDEINSLLYYKLESESAYEGVVRLMVYAPYQYYGDNERSRDYTTLIVNTYVTCLNSSELRENLNKEFKLVDNVSELNADIMVVSNQGGGLVTVLFRYTDSETLNDVLDYIEAYINDLYPTIKSDVYTHTIVTSCDGAYRDQYDSSRVSVLKAKKDSLTSMDTELVTLSGIEGASFKSYASLDTLLKTVEAVWQANEDAEAEALEKQIEEIEEAKKAKAEAEAAAKAKEEELAKAEEEAELLQAEAEKANARSCGIKYAIIGLILGLFLGLAYNIVVVLFTSTIVCAAQAEQYLHVRVLAEKGMGKLFNSLFSVAEFKNMDESAAVRIATRLDGKKTVCFIEMNNVDSRAYSGLLQACKEQGLEATICTFDGSLGKMVAEAGAVIPIICRDKTTALQLRTVWDVVKDINAEIIGSLIY